MKTVTALAVTEDDTSLAVHGSEVSQSDYADGYCCSWVNGEYRKFGGTLHSYVFTVNTNDGGFKMKPIKVTHNSSGSSDYSYMVWSSGFLHSNNNIIMAIHN